MLKFKIFYSYKNIQWYIFFICRQNSGSSPMKFNMKNTKPKGEICMEKRRLEELNLLDDFLFQEVVTRGEEGEQFCKLLLSTILKKKIGKVKVIPQKTVLGRSEKYHGIKIDAKILRSGVDYGKLKNVVIIMILPYDPFGKNRMVYTFENHCKEDDTIEYEDGAKTIYLYTRGIEGNPSKDLQNMLKYIEESTQENARDENLKKIHEFVEKIRHDEEVGINYMKAFEMEKMYIEQGMEIGIQALILDNIEEHVSSEKILKKLQKRFGLTEEEAKEYYKKFTTEEKEN